MKTKALAQTIAGECVAVQIRKLNRAITNIYDEELRMHGLTVGQINILVAVAQIGEITPREIGAHLLLDKSTLSRSLQLMIKNGWLTGARSEAGRKQSVALTQKGEELLTAAAESWAKAQHRAKDLIGQSSLSALFRTTKSLSPKDSAG